MICEEYIQYECMSNIIGKKVYYNDKIGYIDRLPNGQFYDGENWTVNINGVFYLAKLEDIKIYYDRD